LRKTPSLNTKKARVANRTNPKTPRLACQLMQISDFQWLASDL
jgi:hypothetical protein